jgi:hypothetical protein
MAKRKEKPSTVWREEAISARGGHTTDTYDPKLAQLWVEMAERDNADPPSWWDEGDAVMMWKGTITWKQIV